MVPFRSDQMVIFSVLCDWGQAGALRSLCVSIHLQGGVLTGQVMGKVLLPFPVPHAFQVRLLLVPGLP